jgi:hypothetical protein
MAAESAKTFNSEQYNYWQYFGLLLAPGVPMIVVFSETIMFGLNSEKVNLRLTWGDWKLNWKVK